MRQSKTNIASRICCRRPGWRLLVYLLVTCLQLTAVYCQAGTYLLVKSGKGEIYSRFEKSLGMALADSNSQNNLTARDIDTFKSQQNTLAMDHYDAIISAGIDASIAVSALQTDTRVFMAMLPRASYSQLSASGEIACKIKNCRTVFLDQPVIRQLQLLKLVMPNAQQVAVMSSHQSASLANEITNAAGKYGLLIKDIEVTDEDSVLSTLKQDLANSDVLMAIPDPIIYNRNTARAILLSTFYQHIPLFAYSRSFVRAGATFGIYSTPEEIARYVAELVTTKTNIPSTTPWLFPKYYTIDINQRAADALGIDSEDSDLLAKRLKAYENE